MLIDTHAHIHFDDYADRVDEVLTNAQSAGVTTIICVGVNDEDSAKAVTLVRSLNAKSVLKTRSSEKKDQIQSTVKLFATVGLHPHDANRGQKALDIVAQLARSTTYEPRSPIVAIGECGLDYYRNLSSHDEQAKAFRFQIELAQELNLPMVWHVRDAFDDFFRIVDEYPGVQGIVHCFTSNQTNMDKALQRGFYIALNGIMTFTKDQEQLAAAKACPLDRLVLETDCPFLSPAPLRGQVNEPANLRHTAEFLAELRGEDYNTFAMHTSQNTVKLLGLS